MNSTFISHLWKAGNSTVASRFASVKFELSSLLLLYWEQIEYELACHITFIYSDLILVQDRASRTTLPNTHTHTPILDIYQVNTSGHALASPSHHKPFTSLHVVVLTFKACKDG